MVVRNGSTSSERVLLDMVLDEGVSLRLLSPVLNDERRGTSDLLGNALLVVLALTDPLAELLAGLDFDQWDLVLLGEGGDELLVHGVIAVLGKNDDVAIFLIEGFTNLVEALNKSYIKFISKNEHYGKFCARRPLKLIQFSID